MIQSFIVAAIVALAVLYAGWAFMPAAWRRGAAARLARQASRSGLQPARARALQARLERSPACGACASCKGCGPAGTPRQNAEG